MCILLTQSFTISFHSIDNATKDEQDDTYDSIILKQSTSGDNRQVDKVDTKNKMMVTSPTYDYATLNLQPKQINTDNIKMDSNPAYTAAKFT